MILPLLRRLFNDDAKRQAWIRWQRRLERWRFREWDEVESKDKKIAALEMEIRHHGGT